MTGKKRLYTEREKVRHTTHWDMDYLPKEALESYFFQAPIGSGKNVPERKDARRQRRVGGVLIGVGVALFACAVFLGRFISG